MPQPRIEGNANLLQDPHTPTEILGRGEENRKTKTFLKNGEMAQIMGLIRSHARFLMELFRREHARHYTTTQRVEDEDGNVTEETVPEVLTDDEVREEYPIVATWERTHQELVAHYASIEGFSVEKAISGPEEHPRKQEEESSAGADAPQRTNNQPANPRWR